MKHCKNTIMMILLMLIITCSLQSDMCIKAENSAQATFAMCNAQREKIGLPDLIWDDALAQSANIRSKECAEYWSHLRPNGTEYWTIDPIHVYGENLAKTNNINNDYTSMWMKSQEHKNNILNANYKTCGIYIYKNNNMYYCAEEFGY